MHKHYISSHLFKDDCEVYKLIYHTAYSGCHTQTSTGPLQTGPSEMLHGKAC